MSKITPLNEREAKAWAKCPKCIRFASFMAAGLHYVSRDIRGKSLMRNGDGKTSRDLGWRADLYLKPSSCTNGWDCWVNETRVCSITNVTQLREIIKRIKR